MIFLLGGGMIYIGLTSPRPWFALISLPLLVSALGIWRVAPWARAATTATLVSMSAMFVAWLFMRGFTTWNTILLCGSLVFAWSTWRELRTPPETPDEPMISFALLLSESRFLEAPILAKVVSAAWGGTYTGISDESELNETTDEEGDSSRFVVGRSPLFFVQSPAGMFIVHHHEQPYFTEPDKAAAGMKDLRLRHAVENNKAWIAVDAMRAHHPEASRESLYPHVARLVAELSGPDCLAIYQPQTGRLNAWDPSLEQTLKEDYASAMAAPALVPVVDVDGNSPEMKRAVEEARRRFPEFVDAFKRKDGQDFTIKAPVTRGDRTEYIWINVLGFEPEFIHGTLGNEPVDLGGLKLGDRVEVPIGDLNDWVYMKNDKPVGLFTRKAMGLPG